MEGSKVSWGGCVRGWVSAWVGECVGECVGGGHNKVRGGREGGRVWRKSGETGGGFCTRSTKQLHSVNIITGSLAGRDLTIQSRLTAVPSVGSKLSDHGPCQQIRSRAVNLTLKTGERNWETCPCAGGGVLLFRPDWSDGISTPIGGWQEKQMTGFRPSQAANQTSVLSQQ